MSLSDAQQREIIATYRAGQERTEEIAQRFGISKGSLYRLLRSNEIPKRGIRFALAAADLPQPEEPTVSPPPEPAVSIEDRAKTAERALTPRQKQLRRKRVSDQMHESLQNQYERLTPEERDEIRHLRNNEQWSYTRLMRRFGVLNGVITQVLTESLPEPEEEPVTEPVVETPVAQPEPVVVPRNTFAGRFDRNSALPTYPRPAAQPPRVLDYSATVLEYVIAERTITLQATSVSEAANLAAQMDGVIDVVGVTRKDFDISEVSL